MRILEKGYFEALHEKDLKTSKFEDEASNRNLRSRVFEGSPRKNLKFRGEVKGSIFDVFDHPSSDVGFIRVTL